MSKVLVKLFIKMEGTVTVSMTHLEWAALNADRANAPDDAEQYPGWDWREAMECMTEAECEDFELIGPAP